MQRPFVNLEEVEFTDIEENGYYTSKRAQFSAGMTEINEAAWDDANEIAKYEVGHTFETQ